MTDNHNYTTRRNRVFLNAWVLALRPTAFARCRARVEAA